MHSEIKKLNDKAIDFLFSGYLTISFYEEIVDFIKYMCKVYNITYKIEIVAYRDEELEMIKL